MGGISTLVYADGGLGAPDRGGYGQAVSTHVEPLVRPPRLHTGEDRSASRLELFFDLAYVLVVMELASAFVADLTVHGALVLTSLFVTIWFSWVGFTLYANRFDTDDVVFRIAKLAATAAIAGCAASASGAVGKLAVPFAASYLAGRVILLLLYVRAWRHVPDGRPTIRVYLFTITGSAALWAISLAVPGDLRYLLWLAAVLLDAAGPVLATLRQDRLPLHIEHLPERFGLLVILVLGEAVGGAARGVHDADWAGSSVAVGVAGFGVAAAMWWIYFDVAANSSSRQLEEAEVAEEATEGGPGDHDAETESAATDARHDLFVYGHLPLAFGVVLVGVGLEELALHPSDPMPWTGGWVLAIGLAVFLLGVAMLTGGTTQTWRSIWPWPLAGVPVLLAAPLIPWPGGLGLTLAYAGLLVALAARGTLQTRRPDDALAGAT